uniref:Saposin B-type domain-containing protein n=1 Tax=Steinernema glaseri TaxID=37863 RepID=A0A1I7ZW99_9BILA
MRFFSAAILALLLLCATALPKKGFKEQLGLLKKDKGCVGKDSNCVCGPCKDVVAFIRTMILEHKTQDKELLERACLRFFGNDPSRKGFCEKVIDEHLQMILDYVRQKIDPVDVCKLFC